MYLSRIIVDRKQAISKGFRDSYAWHQALWKAFPGHDGEKRNFLSRVDVKGNHFQIFLLSHERPTIPDWGNWQTKKIPEGFLEHNAYQFELRTNPTVKRVIRDNKGNRKKNGSRTAICDYMELKNWMKSKVKGAGFELKDDEFEPSSPVKQVFVRGGKLGKHSNVDFKGILRVKDRKLFKKAFEEGIGPAKSFSFGMLVLQPILK